MPGLLSIDNLDDRREIIILLDKLRPSDRWRWLQWVAKQAKKDGNRAACDVTFNDADRRYLKEAHAGIESSDRWVTNSAYFNAFMLATQYGLDFSKIVNCLEKLARGELEPEDLL